MQSAHGRGAGRTRELDPEAVAEAVDEVGRMLRADGADLAAASTPTRRRCASASRSDSTT